MYYNALKIWEFVVTKHTNTHKMWHNRHKCSYLQNHIFRESLQNSFSMVDPNDWWAPRQHIPGDRCSDPRHEWFHQIHLVEAHDFVNDFVNSIRWSPTPLSFNPTRGWKIGQVPLMILGAPNCSKTTFQPFQLLPPLDTQEPSRASGTWSWLLLRYLIFEFGAPEFVFRKMCKKCHKMNAQIVSSRFFFITFCLPRLPPKNHQKNSKISPPRTKQTYRNRLWTTIPIWSWECEVGTCISKTTTHRWVFLNVRKTLGKWTAGTQMMEVWFRWFVLCNKKGDAFRFQPLIFRILALGCHHEKVWKDIPATW